MDPSSAKAKAAHIEIKAPITHTRKKRAGCGNGPAMSFAVRKIDDPIMPPARSRTESRRDSPRTRPGEESPEAGPFAVLGFSVVALEGSIALSNPKLVWRFQRGAALAADNRGAIAAGERIGYFASALRAVQRGRRSVGLRGPRLVWSHEDGKCSIGELRAASFELRATSYELRATTSGRCKRNGSRPRVFCRKWSLEAHCSTARSRYHKDSELSTHFGEAIMPEKSHTPDENLQQEFNRWAEAGEGEKMRNHHLNITEKALRRMDLRPGERVLDLGCGSGWATRLISRLVGEGPEGFGQVVGLDVSDEMVRQARAASKDFENILHVWGSAQQIPWEENFFDKVLSVESFYYYSDQDRALSELFRVMAPKARLYILINLYKDNPYSLQWVDKLKVPVHVRSAAEYADLLKAHAFEKVDWQLIPDDTPTPDDYK